MKSTNEQILRDALFDLRPIVERGYAHRIIDTALAATEAPVPRIKTWKERQHADDRALHRDVFMQQEIAELRAAQQDEPNPCTSNSVERHEHGDLTGKAQQAEAPASQSADQVRNALTKQQGILLAGLQALCVSADQEWTRQGGKLSEFDKGWFMGQIQSIDFYTEAEKEAVYKCREYIEKLSVAAAQPLYEVQRNAAEVAIGAEFESLFGPSGSMPDMSDDMLTPEQMKRNVRQRKQERCVHDFKHSPGFGGDICAKCAAIKPSPSIAAPESAEQSALDAANYIDKKAEDYLNENSHAEYETGACVFNYGEAGRDYYNTISELADEIREFATSSAAKGEADHG